MFHAGSAHHNLGNIEYAIKIRTSGIVIGTGYGELRKEQGTRHKEKKSGNRTPDGIKKSIDKKLEALRKLELELEAEPLCRSRR